VNGNQVDNSANWAGAAYVFVRNGTTWTQQAYLKASNTWLTTRSAFRWLCRETRLWSAQTAKTANATGVNGNQLNNSAAGAGAVFVFVRSGASWTQQAYLKASNTGVGDSSAGRWLCRATRLWSGPRGRQATLPV